MDKPILKIKLSDHIAFDLIYVEGGEFMMGDKESDYDSERPAHKVKVKDFYMGKYQVTQEQWEAVMKKNPARFKGERRPVEMVSWLDAKDFIRKLNEKTGKNFRLPSEAEWEYAARGGQFSEGYTYAGSDKLKQVGWYGENSKKQTHKVGLLRPNELGLYDMSGNVWEWCEDEWHEDYKNAPADGSAWVDGLEGSENMMSKMKALLGFSKDRKRGASRVMRGGSYWGGPVLCRSAFRDRDWPVNRDGSIGLRLVLSFQSVG